ncbi:MAG TPA: amino acid ABC transporter substrate-binding protein [Devosiaceae bacterium]
MNIKLVVVTAVAAVGLTVSAAQADTLSDVKAKGFLQCGVTEGVAGFSIPDENNNWSGLEVDYCRAMAAAIFNDPQAVRFTPLNTSERFAALSSGEIDVLSRTTTWTMSRDTTLGINFAGVMFYDGQGFMVRKDSGVTSVKDLDGANICVQSGTTTELNMADYMSANNLSYTPVVFAGRPETVAAFEGGRCDAYTTDSSGLAADRTRFANPKDYIILPEIISKEPLGPSVRQGDDTWFNIARWVYFALLDAEELGVTQANVDDMLGSDNPSIKRLLGVEGDFGSPLGLDKSWAYNIIKALGNYGEMYDRNVGPNTAMGLERGINALWTKGGIQYAPPIR